jgi:hypothetical protein
MASGSKSIISNWISWLVPKGMKTPDIEALAKSAKISPGTIRQIRNRGSVSADTIVSLMLARGVSKDQLENLSQDGKSSFSKSLTEWNRIGNKLSEEERQKVLQVMKLLLENWKIKN